MLSESFFHLGETGVGQTKWSACIGRWYTIWTILQTTCIECNARSTSNWRMGFNVSRRNCFVYNVFKKSNEICFVIIQFEFFIIYVDILAVNDCSKRMKNGLVIRISWFMQATHIGHWAMPSLCVVQKNYWVNKSSVDFSFLLLLKMVFVLFSCTTARKSYTSRWISTGNVWSASKWDMEKSISQSKFSCMECGTASSIPNTLYRWWWLLFRYWTIRFNQCIWYVCLCINFPFSNFYICLIVQFVFPFLPHKLDT